MRYQTFFAIIGAILSAAPSIGQSSTNAGLVAFYRFNRGESGNDPYTVYDYTKNHNDGSIVKGVTYTADRFGVGCSAMLFDGTGYITVPSSKSLKKPQSELSIVVWFKLNKGADFFKEWITICCKSDKSYEDDESPQYRMQATAQTVSINTEFTENFIPPLSYEVWYFYAYTFDGSKVRVFLNGKFVFEYDYYGSLTPNDMPLEIGRDLPGGREFFNGAMDDLRIYDRALDENELLAIYQDQSEASSADRCPSSSPVTSVTPPIQKIKTDPPADPGGGKTRTKKPAQDSTSIQAPGTKPKKQPPVDTTATVVSSPLPGKTDPDPKKDTTAAPPKKADPDPKKDTTAAPPKKADPNDSYRDLPSKIGNVPIEYQKKVVVKNSEITIYPYDHDKEDGDIVSINVNGVWVRDKYELKSKKPNPSEHLMIKCSLNPGDYNYFVSKAWNLGSISPNTLTIEIDDGHSVQKVHINAKVGLSGGIRIVCDQQ